MSARVRTTYAEDTKHEHERYPVYDGEADCERSYHCTSKTQLQELILEIIRDEGGVTQYALWKELTGQHGLTDPKQALLSAQLLILRRDGEVKSTRDGLARKSPRMKPFFSPVWELV